MLKKISLIEHIGSTIMPVVPPMSYVEQWEMKIKFPVDERISMREAASAGGSMSGISQKQNIKSGTNLNDSGALQRVATLL
jgi:hypothetical protein